MRRALALTALWLGACCASGGDVKPTPTPTPVTTGGPCATAADCHLVDDYCGGCACRSFTASEELPLCDRSIVACFREPCGGMTAACVDHHCVTQ